MIKAIQRNKIIGKNKGISIRSITIQKRKKLKKTKKMTLQSVLVRDQE